MVRRRISALLLFLLLLPCTVMAVQLGDRLQSFNQQDMDGKTINMDEIIGKKPVMLVFWASWCPSCKTEVPKVNRLKEQYQSQGMEFIGINIGFNDSLKRARKFIKKTKMDYPVVFDSSNDITKRYLVRGVPTIIVADSEGIVQYKHYGVPEISAENFKLLQGAAQ
ncbi:TlpA family protein disulfide reductase [Desulfogranum mediterraneum]|uniref:TlpA family protein disulfide reductase n=1 Tax=Desulfogranum mediterraneum TaxID=160661 RepID=UPI00041829A8|nr:TlpA disulfide reductase family protein [Desulfogranum mediterraneum]